MGQARPEQDGLINSGVDWNELVIYKVGRS